MNRRVALVDNKEAGIMYFYKGTDRKTSFGVKVDEYTRVLVNKDENIIGVMFYEYNYFVEEVYSPLKSKCKNCNKKKECLTANIESYLFDEKLNKKPQEKSLTGEFIFSGKPDSLAVCV